MLAAPDQKTPLHLKRFSALLSRIFLRRGSEEAARVAGCPAGTIFLSQVGPISKPNLSLPAGSERTQTRRRGPFAIRRREVYTVQTVWSVAPGWILRKPSMLLPGTAVIPGARVNGAGVVDATYPAIRLPGP